MKVPCEKDCPDRYIRQDSDGKTVTCHCECERYRMYKAESEMERKKKLAMGEEAEYFFRSCHKKKYKTNPYSNRKWG